MQVRGAADDATALACSVLYPSWKSDIEYTKDDRVRHGGVLYKCIQSHTSQDTWTPDATPALWAAVSLADGTAAAPITAARGMEYAEGKYYRDMEDGGLYLCTRSGILQYLPHELVGHYFVKEE